MSRPVVVYLVMIVVLIAGLWTVLAIGGTLWAPEDLAGKWVAVQPSSNSAIDVQQSGKFFQIGIEKRPQLDLKEKSTSPTVLANSKWTLTITGEYGSDDKTFDLQGPQPGHWVAHRTVRRFAADPTTQGAR